MKFQPFSRSWEGRENKYLSDRAFPTDMLGPAEKTEPLNEIADTMGLHEINSIEQGFMMLQAKRVEGFAGYDINWDYFLNNSEDFQPSSFKKLPPFGKSEECVTTLKSNPRSETILTTFDAGFDAIRENRFLKAIRGKWLGQ